MTKIKRKILAPAIKVKNTEQIKAAVAKVTSPKKTVVIDRATWRFGGDVSMTGDSIDAKFGETELLNDKGYRCCLGFACQQLYSLTDKKIFNRPEPLNALTRFKWERTVFSKAVRDNDFRTFENLAIDLNDDVTLTREKREAHLTSLFADVGVKLSFTGQYPKGAPK